MEFRHEVLPTKINVAERLIAVRLRDQEELALDEHIALTDALRALQVLLSSLDGQPKPQSSGKDKIA